MQRPSCTVHHAHLPFALKRIFFLSFASKRKQAKYFFLCLLSSTFNFLPLKTLFSGSLARNYRILWHFKFCCHMINSAIRLNKSCPCVLEWFICISVLLLTRGYSLWHLSLLFSTLKLDSRALVGLCPQPPHLPSLTPPTFFFSFYRNWLLTDALQAGLLFEKNPPAAPELPLLLQWCTQKECVLLGWWKNRSGGGRYIVSNVA